MANSTGEQGTHVARDQQWAAWAPGAAIPCAPAGPSLFQSIARRDKKAVLSEQCKETEENNRMGTITGLFKKIRDTKGTFHAEMGTMKDRNGRDLTGAEDIKKRWQKYTENYTKKIFMT